MDLLNKLNAIKIKCKVGCERPDLAPTVVKQIREALQDFEVEFISYDTNLVDDYNTLVDELEQSQHQVSALEAMLVQMNSEQINAQTTISELQNANERLELLSSELKDKQKSHYEERRELRRLQQLNPEKILSQLSKAKLKIKDLQASVAEQAKIQRSIRDLENKLEKKEEVVKTQQQMITHLRNKLIHHDGVGVGKELISESGVRFVIMCYEYGHDFSVKSHINLLTGLDWHCVVKSSMAINLSILCSEWATPYIPPCTEIDKHWHPDLPNHLHEVFMSRLKHSHPDLCARVEWAKDRQLTTLPFEDQDKQRLLDSGYSNVFKVITDSPYWMEKQCFQGNANEETKRFCERVKAVCNKAVSYWESDRKQKLGAKVA